MENIIINIAGNMNDLHNICKTAKYQKYHCMEHTKKQADYMTFRHIKKQY